MHESADNRPGIIIWHEPVSCCAQAPVRTTLSLIVCVKTTVTRPAKIEKRHYFCVPIFILFLSARVGIWVGPEGDFTPDELEAALAAGIVPVSLGDLTLRAETAALYFITALRYEWGQTSG